MRSECLHQAIAHCMQVIFSGPAVVVIHHESFSANRRPFDLLSCVAGDEKQHGLRSFGARQPQSAVSNVRESLCIFGCDSIPRVANQKRSYQFLPSFHSRKCNRAFAVGNRDAVTRNIPADSATATLGPPYGQPLPSVRSKRNPSSRARPAAKRRLSRYSSERNG